MPFCVPTSTTKHASPNQEIQVDWAHSMEATGAEVLVLCCPLAQPLGFQEELLSGLLPAKAKWKKVFSLKWIIFPLSPTYTHTFFQVHFSQAQDREAHCWLLVANLAPVEQASVLFDYISSHPTSSPWASSQGSAPNTPQIQPLIIPTLQSPASSFHHLSHGQLQWPDWFLKNPAGPGPLLAIHLPCFIFLILSQIMALYIFSVFVSFVPPLGYKLHDSKHLAQGLTHLRSSTNDWLYELVKWR